MAKVTLAQARKLLPDFACGLGMYTTTVIAIRDAVMQELDDYASGDNPLTPSQVSQLKRFLVKTDGR